MAEVVVEMAMEVAVQEELVELVEVAEVEATAPTAVETQTLT